VVVSAVKNVDTTGLDMLPVGYPSTDALFRTEPLEDIAISPDRAPWSATTIPLDKEMRWNFSPDRQPS
jgi:hypothetical protein